MNPNLPKDGEPPIKAIISWRLDVDTLLCTDLIRLPYVPSDSIIFGRANRLEFDCDDRRSGSNPHRIDCLRAPEILVSALLLRFVGRSGLNPKRRIHNPSNCRHLLGSKILTPTTGPSIAN